MRLYAEDSAHNFLPQTGRVLRWEPELLEGIRIDHGLVEGQEVTPFYDPMLAKVIAYGATRDDARRKLVRAVEECVLLGVNGNQRFLANLLANPEFASGNATTAFIAEHFNASDESLTPAGAGGQRAGHCRRPALSGIGQQPQPPGGLAGWRSAGSAPWRFILKQGEHKHRVEPGGARLPAPSRQPAGHASATPRSEPAPCWPAMAAG